MNQSRNKDLFSCYINPDMAQFGVMLGIMHDAVLHHNEASDE